MDAYHFRESIKVSLRREQDSVCLYPFQPTFTAEIPNPNSSSELRRPATSATVKSGTKGTTISSVKNAKFFQIRINQHCAKSYDNHCFCCGSQAVSLFIPVYFGASPVKSHILQPPFTTASHKLKESHTGLHWTCALMALCQK